MRTWMGLVPAALLAGASGAGEAVAPVPDGAAGPAESQAAPWKRIFAGAGLAGWHAVGAGSWRVADGELLGECGAEGGGWLLSEEEFANFDLRLSFRIREGGSSGVCIRFPKDPARRRGGSDDPARAGYKIQVQPVPDALEPTGSIAGLARAYAQEYTRESAPYWKPGDWNRLEIAARFDHIRVKLNGRVVADLFDRGSLRGMIGLEVREKDAPVRFKDVEIRDCPIPDRLLSLALRRPTMEKEMEDAPGEWIPLFDGESLAGWKVLWGGRWAVEDGAIVGRWWEPETEEDRREKERFEKKAGMAYGPHGWLCTEKEYGDFILACAFKIDERGNSGLCLRYPSAKWGGDPAWEGYEIQIEDTDARGAWDPSGSVYAVARAYPGLTRSGEWNEYRIYCRGPRIAVYLNGCKAVDFLDTDRTDPRDRTKISPGPRSLEGHIGLQIHDRDKTIRLKDVRIKPIVRGERPLPRGAEKDPGVPAKKRQSRSVIRPRQPRIP